MPRSPSISVCAENPSRPRDEQLPGLGHLGAARGALDEGQSELLLESPDLLRERGLGDVLARGCAREVAFLGQCDEIPKLPKIHKASL
jgi:hypothetical protein